MSFYVYLLFCRNRNTFREKFYTGYTENLNARLKQHRHGKTKSLRGYDIISMRVIFIFKISLRAKQKEYEIKHGYADHRKWTKGDKQVAWNNPLMEVM